MKKQIHHKILNELRLVIQPLYFIVESQEYRTSFFYILGWYLDDLNGIPAKNFDLSFKKYSKKLEQLQLVLEEKDLSLAANFIEIINKFAPIFNVIYEIKSLDKSLKKYLSDEQIDELQSDIIHFLVAKYIYDYCQIYL